MHFRWLLKGLFLAGALLVLGPLSPAYGEDMRESGNAEISTKELSGVVDLLEDSKRRETFVRDLKNLIKVKESRTKESEEVSRKPEEKKEKKLLVIENLFAGFDSFSKRIIGAGASTVSLVSKTPEALGKAKVFLSQRQNRSNFLRLLGTVAGGILVALIVGYLLGRYLPRIEERMRGLPSKVVIGLVQIILRVIPYFVVLLSFFILFKALPSFPLSHSIVLLFFTVLLFYRVALELFRILLSPDNERIRIFPLKGENANYFWVWVLRFARYTLFYFLVTRILFVVEIAPQSFLFIRALLLIGFPLLISVFIMQISREIRTRYETLEKSSESTKYNQKRSLGLIVRYWQIFVIAYAWAIFLFLVVRYEKGFSYLLVATIGTAITILAIFLGLGILDWLFKKLFAINERVRERFPGLEERTNRHIRIIKRVFGFIIVIIGVGVIAHVWGIPVSALIASKSGSLIIIRTITIAITVGVVVFVIETSQFLSNYLLKSKKKGKKKKEPTQKIKTLVPMINTSIRIAAGFVGGIVILDQLGVNTTPILAGAGIVGLAVGFGSQTLVKDLINGLFILFEESIRVGDYVNAGKEGGIVEAVGLRTVRLRDVSGNVHVIPNSSIDTITNMSKEFSRSVIDIGVAYKEDVDEVMEILREIGENMQNDPEYQKVILEPLEIFGLQSFEDSAVIIRTRLTTKPLKQWGVKREFNRRVKKAFDERGIEIPFPHQTIYLGEPKEGPAAPLHVQIRDHNRQGKEPA